MKKILSVQTFFVLLLVNIFVIAQSSYYNSINTSDPAFISQLHNLINPHTVISYDQFDETNIANFASRDTTGGKKVVTCVYSGENYVYTPPFTWSTYSREHTWCQSWMPTGGAGTPQYSDQHHLFPTNQNKANGVRNNYPLGIVVTVTSFYLEAKFGKDALGNTVYEPRNSHKGDAARALMYMAVCYNWQLPSFQDQTVLKQWNQQDPPDAWELARNNYVYSIQNNRNPFVDHPEYAAYINFSNLTYISGGQTLAIEPTNYITNFSTGSITDNSISLSWTDALTGDQVPSGYLIFASNTNTFTSPVDGFPYSDDTNLSDGSATINVSYSGADNYTFSLLTPGVPYYFRIYSYNGTGSQINYKTDVPIPSATATTTGGIILAAEPSNYATGFSTNAVTTNSISVSWSDALAGGQVPSGYLLIGKCQSSFSAPVDGTTYSDDVNLADGNAIINISYAAADNYTFLNLPQNTPYYFRLYSYNGSGTQINYKSDGTTPSTNGLTSGGGGAITVLLSQDWTNTGMISTNNDWSGVSGIVGYKGNGLTATTGVDPQTILVDGTTTDINLWANQTNPNTYTSGGIAEFENSNPTIALNGSGSANAPFLLLNVTTTGYSGITITYNARDLDGSADNAIQQVALHYRIGNTGNFINLPAGYIPDASTGPSLATLVTPINVTLPADAENKSLVQFRIITTNAAGSDEWIGIDDIVVTGIFQQAIATEPTNYVTAFSALSFTDHAINLGWTDAAFGSQVPSGYMIVANITNVFSDPVDGTLYTNDLNLSDGSAIVNINYNDPDTYSFSGLSITTDYYFKIFSYNDVGGTINYKIDGTVPQVTVKTTVPVELASFKANFTDNKVALNWITTTETNNLGFDIERSTTIDQQTTSTNSNWQKIGFVNGKGSSTNISHYQFLDKNLSDGKYSYRLKQIDFNGSYNYSSYVEVEVKTEMQYSLQQNFPNPFNPTTAIAYTIPQQTYVKLSIVNTLGETVKSIVNEIQEAGKHHISVDGSDLSSGVYFYKLEAGNYLSIKKMVLLR
ncbi:MAG: endonuclease [Ignavibacteriales bacterium]|nr:endonuclease [Ignavibacteriales bacterium]